MILDAGQHRKAVLESLLLDRAAAAAKPPAPATDGGTPPPVITMPTDQDYLWAVNVYCSDAIDMKMWMALRSNRREVNNPDSDGRTALTKYARMFFFEHSDPGTAYSYEDWTSGWTGKAIIGPAD
ncbi:hypothetical protein IFM5058_11076 [Aspergillus udagawae]|nr:hypothetical protein IFM5058_11076 [Aspergillus udagawae]